MAEPLFGFLTSLVDIHFPGQTGPAAGDKYNIDITFFSNFGDPLAALAAVTIAGVTTVKSLTIGLAAQTIRVVGAATASGSVTVWNLTGGGFWYEGISEGNLSTWALVTITDQRTGQTASSPVPTTYGNGTVLTNPNQFQSGDIVSFLPPFILAPMDDLQGNPIDYDDSSPWEFGVVCVFSATWASGKTPNAATIGLPSQSAAVVATSIPPNDLY